MSPALTVGEVALVLARRYPAGQADGLLHGDPDAPVRAILLAVDPTPAVIAEATSLGAGLVVTHGSLAPPATPLGPDDPALYVADASARGDAAQALASAIGLRDIEPLVPGAEPLDTLVTFVPDEAVDQVIDALADAGAGTLGHYRRCAWTTRGVGTFIPQEAARPAIGSAGIAETVPETRVEMMAPRSLRDQVIAQLTVAHPYEEPAYYLSECVQRPRGPARGSVGLLDRPMKLAELTVLVSERLPSGPVRGSELARGGTTPRTPRASGQAELARGGTTPRTPRAFGQAAAGPGPLISAVAVSGEADDQVLAAAKVAGADAYLAGGLDGDCSSGLALLALSRRTAIRPWLDVLATYLRASLPPASAPKILISPVVS